MKNLKVAIVGAGICGLYLAWKLSEKGHKVTVFEKKKRIGNEVCSGLFSQRILEFIPESQKLIQNQIKFVLLHFPKKTVTVKFSKDFFVISHFELDKLVADFAQKSRAKIILNHNVSSMPEGFDRVIGCDGAHSFVRRYLDLSEPNYRLGILGFVETRSLVNRDRVSASSVNFVEVWPYQEGFIWKIPRTGAPAAREALASGRGQEIEYGINADFDLAKKTFENFLERGNISLERIKSKIVPQGFVIPKNPSITLCGDAAGLTKPWSGGGVIWGLTAAEILLKNFPDFLKYKKIMKRFFLPKIVLAKAGVRLVYFGGFRMPWLFPSKIRMESDFLV